MIKVGYQVNWEARVFGLEASKAAVRERAAQGRAWKRGGRCDDEVICAANKR